MRQNARETVDFASFSLLLNTFLCICTNFRSVQKKLNHKFDIFSILCYNRNDTLIIGLYQLLQRSTFIEHFARICIVFIQIG